MRRTFVGLAALALLAPVTAQEPVPAPATPGTTTVMPAPVRSGPFSRFTTRRGEVMVTPGTMTVTTVENGKTRTETFVMEPVMNSRGRVIGYRQVTPVTTPATATAKTETKTETNPIKQASNTETQVEKTETTVVNPSPMVQPAPERRRGLLSRIFRRY
ncbi:MAG TPA: hypothetical protein PKA06_14370 [Gemmatales bacterium]|nr:hypothetical protein [Gemmatales bacterium]